MLATRESSYLLVRRWARINDEERRTHRQDAAQLATFTTAAFPGSINVGTSGLCLTSSTAAPAASKANKTGMYVVKCIFRMDAEMQQQ